jgi:hypothetical protein
VRDARCSGHTIVCVGSKHGLLQPSCGSLTALSAHVHQCIIMRHRFLVQSDLPAGHYCQQGQHCYVCAIIPTSALQWGNPLLTMCNHFTHPGRLEAPWRCATGAAALICCGRPNSAQHAAGASPRLAVEQQVGLVVEDLRHIEAVSLIVDAGAAWVHMTGTRAPDK